ncbi:MAG TPA: response regulator transcription factor [Panacibacter sp.]|nr:response regulator transcription factor [Panacibacter sp.]
MQHAVIHLAILDDHQIVIDGLKLLLQDHSKFEIIAEANSAEEMLQQLRQIKVDVLLTDITMPHGISGYDLSLLLKEEIPQLKILALSMSEEGGMITKMIEQAQVDGYIPKAAGQKELLTAIEKIAAGEKYFAKDILLQYELYKAIRSENKIMNLTARELEIIKCILKHYSNKQIADELFISERTVETHRKNIYRKTETKGEASLIRFVTDHKIIS